MSLLFDQNLSDQIPARIADLFPESRHVKSIGLDQGKDAAIVKWAGRNDYVIVSKDTDFYQSSIALGYPRKFIWLRVGNCPTSFIVELIRSKADIILEFMARDEESVLILDKPHS